MCVCVCVCVYVELQESSYCYWPGEEGEEMVCGRLRVRLVKIDSMGDIVERKFEVTPQHFPDALKVKLIQLTSWPPQGLPHPSAITALITKLNNTLMSSSSKQAVVMCRLASHSANSHTIPTLCSLSVMGLFGVGHSCVSTLSWNVSRQKVWWMSSRPSSLLAYRDLESCLTLYVSLLLTCLVY